MSAWAWTAYPSVAPTGATGGTWTVTAPTADCSFGTLDFLMGYNGNAPPAWGGHGVFCAGGGVYTWTEAGPGGGFSIDSAQWVKATDHSVIYATWQMVSGSPVIYGAPGPVAPKRGIVVSRRSIVRASVI